MMGVEGRRAWAGNVFGRCLLLIVLGSAVVAGPATGASAQSATIFADGFETGLAGWTQSGRPQWHAGIPRSQPHSIPTTGMRYLGSADRPTAMVTRDQTPVCVTWTFGLM